MQKNFIAIATITIAITASLLLSFSCGNVNQKKAGQPADETNRASAENESPEETANKTDVPAEDSISAAVENKYFTKEDLLAGKSLAETIGAIDEEHFLLYVQSLMTLQADEKLAAYKPYQEKELSKETGGQLLFEGGYSFVPETIRLQISDSQIEKLEKYEDTHFQYDGGMTVEATTSKSGLQSLRKKSREKYYSKSPYSESETTYEYDGKGNIVSAAEKDGSRTEYFYDENSNLIKTAYPDGSESTYDYENNLRVCEHHSDYDKYIKYNGQKLPTEEFIPAYSSSWTASDGNTYTDYTPASYERTCYDTQGKIKLTWHCIETETSFEYDDKGNLRRSFDTSSGEQIFEAAQDTSAKAASDAYQGDNDKWPVEQKAREFDEKGNLIHEFGETPYDPYEYWFINDKYGNVLIKKQNLGIVRIEKYFYEYDSRGNIIHKIAQDEKEEFYKYDDQNRLLTSFTICYDYTWCWLDFYEDGRLVKRKEWKNSMDYYQNGNLVMTQNTVYKYDGHENPVYSYSGEHYVTYFKNEYDNSGRLVRRQEYHSY